jgi:hypothetical protein
MVTPPADSVRTGYVHVTDPEGAAQVTDRQVEVQGLVLSRDEASTSVEHGGVVAQGVHDDDLEADLGGQLRKSMQGSDQQLRTQPPALTAGVDGQPRDQDRRHGIGPVTDPQCAGGIVGVDLVGPLGVVADDPLTIDGEEGAGVSSALGLGCVPAQPLVEVVLAARERLAVVGLGERDHDEAGIELDHQGTSGTAGHCAPDSIRLSTR